MTKVSETVSPSCNSSMPGCFTHRGYRLVNLVLGINPCRLIQSSMRSLKTSRWSFALYII